MLRNFAISVLIACAFALSLFYRSYQDPLQFPVIALLSTAFLLALPRRQITIPSSAPVIALIALTILTLLTFTLSTIPFSSQIAFCIFCALPLSFITLSLNRHPGESRDPYAGKTNIDQAVFINPMGPGFRRDDGKILVALSCIIFLALSFWAIAQNLITGTRAPGPFLDPNMMATILSIGLLCTTGLTLLKKKPLFTILALTLFAGLVSTGSRSGLAASLIALFTLTIASRIRFQRKIIIPVALAALAILALLGTSLFHQIGDMTNTTAPSVTDRLALWQAALQIALDHPLFGTGPGTFHFYYPAYRGFTDQSLGNFAHADPLQMAAEMGFAAPVLFYGFLITILLRTRDALKYTIGLEPRLAVLIPFTALLTIALQAHINYPLYMLPVLIACGVLLALWHHATSSILNNGLTPVDLPTLPKCIAVTSAGLLIALCILGLSFTASAGLYYLHKSQTATNPQATLIALGGAEHYAPLSFIDPEVEMARTNLHLIDQTDSIKSPKLKETLLTETTRLLDNATYWNPTWAEIDFLRGELQKIRGNKALMVADWKETIRKNPMHFDARRNLAAALLAEGNREDAINIVTDGLKYPHTMAYRGWATAFLTGKKSP